MVDVQYIIATSAAIINMFKGHIPANVVPFATVVLAVVLNSLNAMLVGGDIMTAASTAFVDAGVFAGLFAAGDALRKSDHTPMKPDRE